jgi:hypothetical protein
VILVMDLCRFTTSLSNGARVLGAPGRRDCDFSPAQVGVLDHRHGLIGARFDQRGLLLTAACLMIATGIAFAVVNDYAVLLLIAFAGTNPSAGSVSIFVLWHIRPTW